MPKFVLVYSLLRRESNITGDGNWNIPGKANDDIVIFSVIDMF